MRRSIALVFVVAMIVGSQGTAAEEKAPPAIQFQFTVRIFEGDPLGSTQAGTIRGLADSRVITLENRPASVSFGQVISVPDVTNPVELGRMVEMIPSIIKDGKICLDIKLSNTTAGDKKNGRGSSTPKQPGR